MRNFHRKQGVKNSNVQFDKAIFMLFQGCTSNLEKYRLLILNSGKLIVYYSVFFGLYGPKHMAKLSYALDILADLDTMKIS
jgi:hypothetical protein